MNLYWQSVSSWRKDAVQRVDSPDGIGNVSSQKHLQLSPVRIVWRTSVIIVCISANKDDHWTGI